MLTRALTGRRSPESLRTAPTSSGRGRAWVALYLVTIGACCHSQTTETIAAVGVSTAPLRSRPEYFVAHAQEKVSTLPQVSVVAGETSRAEELTKDSETSPVVAAATPAPVATTTSTAAQSDEAADRLPVKVDVSTTVVLANQLLQFEKQNRVGETFLLASDLVRQDPKAEFAYDAVIRASLILRNDRLAGAKADQLVEDYLLDAIVNTYRPGKYCVQLAHYLARTGKTDNLNRLIADYEKNGTGQQDYVLTLVRMLLMAGDYSRAKTLLEKEMQQETLFLPVAMMLVRILLDEGATAKAAETLMYTADQDFGTRQQRALLLQYLKLPQLAADQVVRMFAVTLAGEPNYRRARGIADFVIERLLATRAFHSVRDLVRAREESRAATDAEIWLHSLMAKRQGDESEALSILTELTTSTTPLLAYERAMSLVQAKRYGDAIPILRELLREQVSEVPLRLTLAQQYALAGHAQNVLQVLSPLYQEKLPPAQRLQLCEMAVSAAVATRDVHRIVLTWMDLGQMATFLDRQAMGDVILKSLQDETLRRDLTALVDERIGDPRDWSLLLLRARLSALEGAHEAELDFYTRFLDHTPTDVQMLQFVAQLANQYAGIPLKIEKENVAKDKDGEARPGAYISLHAVNTAGPELAARLYRQLIAIQPDIRDNYSGLMRAHQLRGEVETAKKVALEFAERRPLSAEQQAGAAQLLVDNGFAPEAIPFLRKALQMDPGNRVVVMQLAKALRAARVNDKAVMVYREILENGYHGKPYNQPQVLESLLQLATEAKQMPMLVEYLAGLKDKNIPGKPEFLLSASKLFMQVHEELRAEDCLQYFQETFPDSPLGPDSYLLQGQLYFSQQETSLTIEALARVIEKYPNSPAAVTAKFNIGEAQSQSGDARAAIATWTELATSHPNEDRALASLYEAAMTAYADLKDPTRSIALFQRFIESGSQDFRLLRRARENIFRIRQGQAPQEAETP